MVKGHPAYSGTIMTATFETVRELGWGYYEKLSKQRVMQVQSSTDPPKKLSLGERAVMADGNEYGIVLLKEAGQPVVTHRTRRERDATRLFDQRLANARMAMALVDGRIRADAIEVAISVNVPQPDAFGAFHHQIDRVIVLGAVTLLRDNDIASLFRKSVMHDDRARRVCLSR